VLGDRVEQGHALDPVARGARPALVFGAAEADRLLHARDQERLADLPEPPVAEVDHLGEVVPRVDVHHRERQPPGTEGLEREVQEHDGVLARREEQDGALPRGDDLAEDEDGLALERGEVSVGRHDLILRRSV